MNPTIIYDSKLFFRMFVLSPMYPNQSLPNFSSSIFSRISLLFRSKVFYCKFKTSVIQSKRVLCLKMMKQRTSRKSRANMGTEGTCMKLNKRLIFQKEMRLIRKQEQNELLRMTLPVLTYEDIFQTKGQTTQMVFTSDYCKVKQFIFCSANFISQAKL